MNLMLAALCSYLVNDLHPKMQSFSTTAGHVPVQVSPLDTPHPAVYTAFEQDLQLFR